MTSKSNPILESENIKKSGRWEKLNDSIINLAQNKNNIEIWNIAVFERLAYYNFKEYLKLKKAFEEKEDISLICFHTRNLLEILIWIFYCSKDVNNAHKFYKDGAYDFEDIIKSLKKWENVVEKKESLYELYQEAHNDLKNKAKEIGIGLGEETYTRVQAASKEIKLFEFYSVANKILSKHIHPTAYQIIFLQDNEETGKLKEAFFSMGCQFFIGSFIGLENQINELNE